MTEGTNSNRRARLFAALAALVLIFAAHSVAVAQAKYKPGDKVECETTGSGKY